jgi:hypothetical protein
MKWVKIVVIYRISNKIQIHTYSNWGLLVESTSGIQSLSLAVTKSSEIFYEASNENSK